jgi:hypothetical protein
LTIERESFDISRVLSATIGKPGKRRALRGAFSFLDSPIYRSPADRIKIAHGNADRLLKLNDSTEV